MCMFPKPGDRKPVAVRVTREGREIINKATAEGGREYRRRVLAMLERQFFRCCLEGYAPGCPGWLTAEDATFEHEWGRGMAGAKRDDRIEYKNGIWVNGAAHALCNSWKGSRYIDYNRTLQRLYLAAITAPQEKCDG